VRDGCFGDGKCSVFGQVMVGFHKSEPRAVAACFPVVASCTESMSRSTTVSWHTPKYLKDYEESIGASCSSCRRDSHVGTHLSWVLPLALEPTLNQLNQVTVHLLYPVATVLSFECTVNSAKHDQLPSQIFFSGFFFGKPRALRLPHWRLCIRGM
jgi:hypothetical protein